MDSVKVYYIIDSRSVDVSIIQRVNCCTAAGNVCSFLMLPKGHEGARTLRKLFEIQLIAGRTDS